MTEYKPLPWRQLIIICICRFSEPICFTIIFPYVVFLVRDFGIPEERAGYSVGWIASSFALAQFCTGIPWGMLSDRIGRRPVILMGMTGTMISIFLFGLSKSFAWAIISRALCGVLNGNNGVLKSMIAELTIDVSEADRAQAFALLPFMFGLGSVIGPVLGGFLADPVKNYPSAFGNLGWITEFLTTYRYFLPSFIASCICFCGWIFGILFLEETLNGKRPQDKKKKNDEEARLLSEGEANYSTFPNGKKHSPTCSPTPTIHESERKPTFREAITRPVILASTAFGCIALHGVFYDELYSLWLSTSRNNGGMGFISKEIGASLAVAGFMTLIVQLFIWPRLAGKFGILRLFQLCLPCFAAVDFVQGFVRYLYHVPDFNGVYETKQWVWVGLITCLILKTICSTIAFTSMMVIVSDSSPRMDTLGAVNGFSQCVSSGCRSIGPAICGILWDYSNHAAWIPKKVRPHVSFGILSMFALLTFAASLRIKPSHRYPKVVDLVDEEQEETTTRI
ncbi:major facilitator superfamily domain-containing protein [Umbelopsis sp. AD052]|nr:major facilitator superfamily domain-containing protein [Umbelopsis sp. AD052]